MHTAEDKNLTIEKELAFIRRHVQRIEGAGREDFETVDEIGMAVESALCALEEYKRSLRPTMTTLPVGVPLAA